jgi:FtsZ-interacting cell division protein ZipA
LSSITTTTTHEPIDVKSEDNNNTILIVIIIVVLVIILITATVAIVMREKLKKIFDRSGLRSGSNETIASIRTYGQKADSSEIKSSNKKKRSASEELLQKSPKKTLSTAEADQVIDKLKSFSQEEILH